MAIIKSFSVEDTVKAGFELGSSLKAGSIVCLDGDLGAGKTAFVKGIAKALGIPRHITSPTFTIVNQYEGTALLYHFDVYRVSSEELLDIGFEEYLSQEAVVVIEWSSLIKEVLPDERIEVFIETGIMPNERIISIKYVKGNVECEF